MSSMLGIDSYTQGKATVKASKEATKATLAAAAAQWKQYEQTRTDMMPWLESGTWALGELKSKIEAGPGEYEKSPYYNFLLEEGTKGLERGAAAKGTLASGAEQKALTQYGQNLASTDYNTWLNNWYQSLTPYQSMSQLGQTTGSQLGATGAQAASQAGNYINQAGQYQAAGTLGKANTQVNALSGLSGILNNVVSQYGQQGINALGSLFSGGGTSASGLTGDFDISGWL